jgi:hypothetical protein
MLSADQMQAAIDVRNVGEWTEILTPEELALGQQALASYTLRQRTFGSVAAAEQEDTGDGQSYMYRDNLGRVTLATFRPRT